MGAATDAELLARAVRNPGRLILAPTAVTGSFPFGGTSLGNVRELELEWDASYYENRDPASGAVSEVVERSVPFPRISCLVEGPAWDEDVLTATFAKSSPSSGLVGNSPPEVRLDGTVIPRVVPAWGKLLFWALDPKGKSVLFRRPVPKLSLRAAVAFQNARKAGLPLLFTPTPDSANATTPFWQVARLENLTL